MEPGDIYVCNVHRFMDMERLPAGDKSVLDGSAAKDHLEIGHISPVFWETHRVEAKRQQFDSDALGRQRDS